MKNILKNQKGMNIIGQGGKIIIFTLPSLIIAILINLYLPTSTSLPKTFGLIKPLGYLWLLLGFMLWVTAVTQLLSGFYKGKLITNGAYGIVRNPIYSSVALFILPAITILTMTWIYIIPSLFLCLGVRIFIGKEEKQLIAIFGKEYNDYTKRVNRIVPFIKFSKKAK